MLLIVSYDVVMLVRITWYTDDSVTTVRDDCSGVMNNVVFFVAGILRMNKEWLVLAIA